MSETLCTGCGATVAIKPEVSEPTPGSVWVYEGTSENTLKFIYITNEGRNATRMAVRKIDGKVIEISNQAFIGTECKPLVQA